MKHQRTTGYKNPGGSDGVGIVLRGLVAAAALCAAGVPAAARAQSPIQLHDVTASTGITFRHNDGSTGRHFIAETMSAGVALFDYDRDGDPDIYFVNGAPFAGSDAPDAPPANALYRNDGGFRFTDVTREAGVGNTAFGLGVAVGDYDADGYLDLYVNNYGPNVLYRNNGDGTFTDVTAEAGVAAGHELGAGTNFLDYDNDGDLDLFVGNYVSWAEDKHADRFRGPWMVYPGPRDYPKNPNALFRNNGDGTFTDVSTASGIASSAGSGMGTVCADYDNDGDTDIVVCNDDWGNFLFQNNGDGTFTENGLVAGIAMDLHGSAQSAMGVTCGDYNNDGWLDLEMTTYENEMATLYENVGGVLFNDVTRVTGAGAGTLVNVTWGNGLVDFDNDGDLDLFIAVGHIDDNVDKYSDIAHYYAKNILLMNQDGMFTDVSAESGDGLQVALSSRGAAFDDLDGDGDMDAVITNIRREPTILRNDSATGNHWTKVRLRGNSGNRDGVGAHVIVTAGDLTRIGEVHSGQGYQSHYGMEIHFGLGQHDRIDRLEVHWIGGGVDVLKNVPVDRPVLVTQGEGEAGE